MFLHQNPLCISLLLHTCQIRSTGKQTSLDFITIMKVLRGNYEGASSNFSQPSVTSLILTPNIFLSILLSKTLNDETRHVYLFVLVLIKFKTSALLQKDNAQFVSYQYYAP
jgi:hypothetical protein